MEVSVIRVLVFGVEFVFCPGAGVVDGGGKQVAVPVISHVGVRSRAVCHDAGIFVVRIVGVAADCPVRYGYLVDPVVVVVAV